MLNREDFSRKGAKAQRRKENPLETRQRFAPLREKSSRKKNIFGQSCLTLNCVLITSECGNLGY